MLHGPHRPTRGSPADLQPDADPEQVARTIVLRRLDHAPRTRRQLADDLARRGVPDDVAERVLTRFTEVGLVDDEAFATAWVDSRHRSRGLSRALLRRELRDRGVADELTEAAVESIDTAAERDRAGALVRSRLRATASLEPQRRARRLAGLLMRRGYSSSVAFAVVRDVLAEQGTDLDRPSTDEER